MFFSPIKTEPIPERVLSISQIVADKGPIDEKDLENILIPSKLSTAKTSYFGPVFETAKELNLIGCYNEGKVPLQDHSRGRLLCKGYPRSRSDVYAVSAFYYNV